MSRFYLQVVLLCLAALGGALAQETAQDYGQAGTPVPSQVQQDDGYPGMITGVTVRGDVDPYEIQRLASPFFGGFGPPIIENAASEYEVSFLTTALDGELVEVTAQLFVPDLPSPESLPLYVFGSGTTGIADICAPSRESHYPADLGYARQYLLAYAGRGFVSIIPDYLGYETPGRYQSYFNAEAEARVMLDASRAVEDFFDRYHAATGAEEAGVTGSAQNPLTTTGAQRSIFLGGYSQGGHAAFAAADLNGAYAPDIEIAGLMGFGATTDVQALLREGPYYAPYIVLSYAQDYGEQLFDPEAILARNWLGDLHDRAGQLCVDEAQAFYPFSASRIYNDDFRQSLTSGTLEEDYPAVAQLLETNNTGLSGHGLPSLIVQGEDDVIVWNETQQAFARELCNQGSDVLYLQYPGVRHRQTRPAGFEESIAWMKSLDRAGSAASTCELLSSDGYLPDPRTAGR